MHFRRHRAKNQRAGCTRNKYWKMNGISYDQYKPSERRQLQEDWKPEDEVNPDCTPPQKRGKRNKRPQPLGVNKVKEKARMEDILRQLREGKKWNEIE